MLQLDYFTANKAAIRIIIAADKQSSSSDKVYSSTKQRTER